MWTTYYKIILKSNHLSPLIVPKPRPLKIDTQNPHHHKQPSKRNIRQKKKTLVR